MKKLFLLPILFLVFGCSSNEIVELEQEIIEINPDDPLIGIWENSSFEGRWWSLNSWDEFKVDGTYEVKTYDVDNTYGGTWRNKDGNINEQIQTYIIDGVENEASFDKFYDESEKFDFVVLTNKETDSIITLFREIDDNCECVTPPSG